MRTTILVAVSEAEGHLEMLIDEVFAVVPPAFLGEVVIVDDASSDGTAAVAKTLIARSATRNLRYLRHDSRCGRDAAIRTGVLAAQWSVIATLSGDGSSDPVDIGRLLDRLAMPGAPGAALVCGVRPRHKDNWYRRRLADGMSLTRRLVLGDRTPDPDCPIKVYWRDTYLLMPNFQGSGIYLPVLFARHGHTVVSVPINDRPLTTRCLTDPDAAGFTRMIGDLAGMAWLCRRTCAPVVGEHWPDGGLGLARPPFGDVVGKQNTLL